MADGVARFRAAAFTDVASLRSVARPLIPLLQAFNAAYVGLARRRFSALPEITRGIGLSPAGARGLCMLRRTESFHWNEQRSLINSLLLPVIRAWRHELSDEGLELIRQQQRREWADYELLLRHYIDEELRLAGSYRCSALEQSYSWH